MIECKTPHEYKLATVARTIGDVVISKTKLPCGVYYTKSSTVRDQDRVELVCESKVTGSVEVLKSLDKEYKLDCF